jgi:hypothetical protein
MAIICLSPRASYERPKAPVPKVDGVGRYFVLDGVWSGTAVSLPCIVPFFTYVQHPLRARRLVASRIIHRTAYTGL